MTKEYYLHCWSCKKQIPHYSVDTYLKEDNEIVAFCNMNCATEFDEKVRKIMAKYSI
jgi:hypothetical protein